MLVSIDDRMGHGLMTSASESGATKSGPAKYYGGHFTASLSPPKRAMALEGPLSPRDRQLPAMARLASAYRAERSASRNLDAGAEIGG